MRESVEDEGPSSRASAQTLTRSAALRRIKSARPAKCIWNPVSTRPSDPPGAQRALRSKRRQFEVGRLPKNSSRSLVDGPPISALTCDNNPVCPDLLQRLPFGTVNDHRADGPGVASKLPYRPNDSIRTRCWSARSTAIMEFRTRATTVARGDGPTAARHGVGASHEPARSELVVDRRRGGGRP